MSVRYLRGNKGRFRGSVPAGPVAPPPVTISSVLSDADDDPSQSEDGLADAWVAFEQSKKHSASADPAALAAEALANYRQRASEATNQDDLYDAEDAYHAEIANIPLGHMNCRLDAAWREYGSIDDFPSDYAPAPSPWNESHGWLYVVAARSTNPTALSQVWDAAEIISRGADEMDPRLDTADSVRLHLLEINYHTPPAVIEAAYDEERLDQMMEDPESDYVEHLVRVPAATQSMSPELQERIAIRIGEWAERSPECAQDIDDAARDLGATVDSENEAVIPVFLMDANQQVLARFANSPSRAVASSVRAAASGYSYQAS